jgi:hypothetical protein
MVVAVVKPIGENTVKYNLVNSANTGNYLRIILCNLRNKTIKETGA